MKATQACALFLLILLLCPLAAQAGMLGPALSYNELLALVQQARDGDVLLVSGDLSATDEALVTPALLEITGDGKATLRHLHVSDSSIVFSNLSLLDSFTVDGVSNIELRTVRVEGASGQYGLSFVGGGTLLIDEDSSVAGGTGATGVSISQRGGDLYVSIEGSVRGGADGGSGMEVSPMTEYGTMMLAGNICGGDGTTMGGTGLNLFDLSGNAFITVAGSVRGGKGSVGGAGMQVVSIGDTVSIGVNGEIRGGSGAEYGGDALILMDATAASSVNLSGSLIGGNASSRGGEPGQSLLVVGDSVSHARVVNCLLQDGENTFSYDTVITPLPEITSSVETVCLLSKLQSKEHIEIEVKMDELDLTSAESKATYEEIREYVFEHTGLKVSHLYIAQVKQKYGIIERENYNKPKSEDTRQPQCPPEKEKAITEALKHFGMI